MIPAVLALAPLDSLGRATLTESQFPTGGHRILAVYTGDPHYQGSQSGVLVQLVRSCMVSAALSQRGPVSLDLVAGAGQSSANHFTLFAGKTKVTVSNPLVTYCANPGRANEQAVVSGAVAARVGRFHQGDPLSVTLRTQGARRAPVAIVLDPAAGQRIVLLGPFNSDSGLKITTI
ncbi:MAG TPA: Ig-like domain-containing protein [Chloroflexota bacterium]|nr:Ig-like domain-containing protein [Chloroflexota bacterium]